MLEVTDHAANVLKQMLAQVDAPDTHGLRLMFGQNGPAIVPDEVRPSDVAILRDEDDRPLVVAEPAVAERLDGHKIDFNPTSSELVVT
jgi:Fe-S cluster assembly iron-binding protein IscA